MSNYNQGYPNYGQGQPPYQQSNIPNPPRPPKTWWQRNALLVSLLGGGALVIALAIYFAFAVSERVKKNMDQAVDVASDFAETYTDNQLQYDNLYAIFSSDNAKYASWKAKTDALKKQTDAILAEINTLSEEYKDTVNSEKKGFLGGITISQRFFIRAGRAHRLKLDLEKYMASALQLTGESSDNDDEYYSTLPTDHIRYKGSNWEITHFSSPAIGIKSVFSSLRNEIRTFEERRLQFISDNMNTVEEKTDSAATN